jgi:GNAT superfamily N-acetyltransferase
MGITIREPGEGDFFPWLGLYEQFADARGATLTDLVALRVWSWLTDDAAPERGLVAVDESGALVALVHFHEVPRPLNGDRALELDDLFVAEDHRSAGTARALLDAVVGRGAQRGIRAIQWIDRSGDDTTRALSETHGDRTDAALYTLRQETPQSGSEPRLAVAPDEPHDADPRDNESDDGEDEDHDESDRPSTASDEGD